MTTQINRDHVESLATELPYVCTVILNAGYTMTSMRVAPQLTGAAHVADPLLDVRIRVAPALRRTPQGMQHMVLQFLAATWTSQGSMKRDDEDGWPLTVNRGRAWFETVGPSRKCQYTLTLPGTREDLGDGQERFLIFARDEDSRTAYLTAARDGVHNY